MYTFCGPNDVTALTYLSNIKNIKNEKPEAGELNFWKFEVNKYVSQPHGKFFILMKHVTWIV